VKANGARKIEESGRGGKETKNQKPQKKPRCAGRLRRQTIKCVRQFLLGRKKQRVSRAERRQRFAGPGSPREGGQKRTRQTEPTVRQRQKTSACSHNEKVSEELMQMPDGGRSEHASKLIPKHKTFKNREMAWDSMGEKETESRLYERRWKRSLDDRRRR